MKILSFLLLLVTINLSAQDLVEIYSKQVGNEIIIYADSDEHISCTVLLELQLDGMKSDLRKGQRLVVPPKTKEFVLATAQPKARARSMGLSMNSTIIFGDITKAPDRSFVYDLPYKSDQPVEIYQGYNGRFSHSGEKALDFGLDIGDKVHAARGGIVAKVVEHHSKGCASPSCRDFNNHVVVYHDDGSFSEYVHLEKNGSLVNVGDVISKGDLIGISGNTGWSSGPHLHFMVYQMKDDGSRETISTKFNTVDRKGIMLKEGLSYN